MKQYVVYIRVSTRKQGESGLGLESQRKICCEFIAAKGGEKVAEYKDVESGTHRDRRGLADAIAYCKKNGCALVIAKLDRLARDVEFCFKVINTGIEIHFVDMPQINTLLLGVFAAVAQYERELTSERTIKALAAKRERGEKTGGASVRWADAYNKKNKEQKHEEGMKKGKTKNRRYLESRDVQAFFKILRKVFPSACIGEPIGWDFKQITTKEEFRLQILTLMRDYKELDENLFAKWDFCEDLLSNKLQVKLATFICNLKKSIRASENFKKLEYENE